jgi:hypothetical protein
MVKALARAFRWRKMLDTGVYATLEDLARAKGVAPSYASRVLRLTLLAPEIVEAIVDRRQPPELQVDDLLDGFPLAWEGQRESLAINDPNRRSDAERSPIVRGGRSWFYNRRSGGSTFGRALPAPPASMH